MKVIWFYLYLNIELLYIWSIDSNIECFSNLLWNEFVNMDRGICVADNAIATISSMKQSLRILFSFQKCWSNSSSSFAVSESPSGNVNKKWSSLKAVRGFKVKDRFPSKSVQRNSIKKSAQRNSTRDFWQVWWGPALSWLALGLLANLKETRKVNWVCRVETTSIMSVVKE